MKIVILAGGLGTRVSEETVHKPKPMIDIGGYPILWHIMKIYYHYGFKDFIICLGYKGEIIREFFFTYFQDHCKYTKVDLQNNKIMSNAYHGENWKIELVDTGDDAMTGGRILAVRDYIGDEPFCLTYGDGVSDIDIPASIAFHKQNKSIVTVTCVEQPYRFGKVELENNYVKVFSEKPNILINAGFFVCEPEIFNYLHHEQDVLETDCLSKMSAEGKVTAYIHKGFWHPLDMLRDKHYLNKLWDKNKAPWKIWSNQ